MSWLTEQLTGKKLLASFGSQILPLDFEDMLNDLKGALERVTKHFQMEVGAKYFDNIAQSPALKRYSKAPDEHEYSPELRAQILADARKKHEAEIKKGLAWLEKLAAKHTDVAELLQQKPA
jgi:hypothetical protein